jgi:hypothetical protein
MCPVLLTIRLVALSLLLLYGASADMYSLPSSYHRPRFAASAALKILPSGQAAAKEAARADQPVCLGMNPAHWAKRAIRIKLRIPRGW